MKKTLKSIGALAAALVTFGFVSERAEAVIISDLQISNNSFSVSFSGILPSSLPSSYSNIILAVNPDQFENPGFVVGPDFTDSTSESFSGSQSASYGRLGGQGFGYGDYLILAFNSNLGVNDDISGVFAAAWNSSVFDSSAITSLDFYWGAGGNFTNPADTVGGQYLGSATVGGANVPDASSTALLLGVASIGLAVFRRRVQRA